MFNSPALVRFQQAGGPAAFYRNGRKELLCHIQNKVDTFIAMIYLRSSAQQICVNLREITTEL
jgi:hypothetical protein